MKKISNKAQRPILLSSLFVLLILVFARCKDTGKSTYTAVDTELTDSALLLPSLTGNVPLEVSFPSDFTGNPEVDARPFFDIFSWEMFIALSWPRDGDNRGVPKNPADESTFLNMTNTTPIVWTSYKNQFDLFGQEDKRPSSWDSWGNPVNVCEGSDATNHVFGISKSSTLDGSEIDEAFSYPLIDQEKNYVLFEMRFNKEQYNFVRGQDDDSSSWLYIRNNLINKLIQTNDNIVMPESSSPKNFGALMVKAAWKELTARDNTDDYYVIDEEIYDPISKTCTTKKMGLVGLHLVQKLKGFEQWIWSSFEHRNNVPGHGSQEPYSFNNGTNNPTTKGGWANKPDSLNPIPKDKRIATQVTRFNEIPTTPTDSSTVVINQLYQEKLKNTVWKNYQLVITQWPTKSKDFKIPGHGGIYPQDSGAPFPIDGSTNTAAETYFQEANDATGAGGNSCIQCHYTTAKTDFSWSLAKRAHN